jgi:hypothetical protein
MHHRLHALLQALMERSPDSVTTQGVTRSGFMQLQAMMIQQQRLDICWTMLRSFGYNRQLHLKPDMFSHIKDLAADPVRTPSSSALSYCLVCAAMAEDDSGMDTGPACTCASLQKDLMGTLGTSFKHDFCNARSHPDGSPLPSGCLRHIHTCTGRAHNARALQNTVCMLSSEAVAFLKTQFQRRCSLDGLLPLDLLLEDTGPQSLFHHAPPVSNHAEHPLGKQNIRSLLVHGIHARKLPLESFLCIWAYCALVDARKAVVAMLYLGYPDTYRRCSSLPRVHRGHQWLKSVKPAKVTKLSKQST